MKRIAVIPGDGIGPEVVREAVRVLKHLQGTKGLELKFVDFDWGAEKYLRDGVTLPEGALEMLAADFDAILAGAFGESVCLWESRQTTSNAWGDRSKVSIVEVAEVRARRRS